MCVSYFILHARKCVCVCKCVCACLLVCVSCLILHARRCVCVEMCVCVCVCVCVCLLVCVSCLIFHTLDDYYRGCHWSEGERVSEEGREARERESCGRIAGINVLGLL